MKIKWMAKVIFTAAIMAPVISKAVDHTLTPSPTAQLTAKIDQGTPESRQQTLAEMLQMLKTDPGRAIPAATGEWANALTGVHMPEAVVKLTTAALDECKPAKNFDADQQADLWNRRIRALLELNKTKEAVDALHRAEEWKVGDRALSGKIHYESVVRSALAAKQYDDVISLALPGILKRASDTNEVSELQKALTQAYLNSEKYDQALAAAKGWYNVCPLSQTADAIQKLGMILINARPDDATALRRFKAQQVALASPPDKANPDTALKQGEVNVLETIKIDEKPYDAAIKAITHLDYSTLNAKGNLLLLADHGAEARKCFETAIDLAQDDDQLAKAIEGVARSIRAQERGVGGANAYILSRRKAQ